MVVDIELTSRCNASCSFCPRHATPRLGSMSSGVFTRALDRAVEHAGFVADRVGASVGVTFCGQGEPLVHPGAVEFVSEVTARGLRCWLTTNAALLDERRATGLIDAGLAGVWVTVADLADTYRSTYGLDFDAMVDNVVRFRDMAEGRVTILLGLMDRGDAGQTARLREFWTALGFERFAPLTLLNRGGALDVDGMDFAHQPERFRAQALMDTTERTPGCAIPFAYTFIGFDGSYYLCSSDWRKEAAFGTVFDRSIAATLHAKAVHTQRAGRPCAACSSNPANRLSTALRLGGDADAELAALEREWSLVEGFLDGIDPSGVVRGAVQLTDPVTVELRPTR